MNALNLASSPTSNAGRTSLAKKGQTAYGKSYPVPNARYYHKAVQAIGRAPASKRGVLKRFLRKRGKQLGIKPSPAVASSYSNEMTMAGSLPVAGASDGPRVVSMAGSKLGLQPHQVKAYARFRKRGASHKAAMTFARRVRSRANEMGSAASVGSGTGSKAYSRDFDLAVPASTFRNDTPASNARGAQIVAGGAKKGRGTDQKSRFVQQRTPAKVSPGGNEGGPRKTAVTSSKVPKLRMASQPTPGGRLLNRSAGKYPWPNSRQAGPVPRTPVNTGQGFKTPSNLNVNTLMDENNNSIRVSGTNKQRGFRPAGGSKASVAYGKLRSLGISHATAMKVVQQYHGAGRPKNSLGTRKGGSMTNLRMKQTPGTGVSRAPKVR